MLQTSPTIIDPNPSIADIVQRAIAAYGDHSWILLGAIVVGGLVALTKTGWLGTWLQQKIPAPYRPIYALALSVVTMGAAQIEAGVDWKHALMNCVYATATAVFAHQTVVEGARHGSELVGHAPWSATKPPSDNGAPPSKAA
jgi:hypothetical protein